MAFDPTLPFVLRQAANFGGMEALVSGALHREGPCLYLSWGGERHLLRQSLSAGVRRWPLDSDKTSWK